jgi:hypothetical protein
VVKVVVVTHFEVRVEIFMAAENKDGWLSCGLLRHPDD